MNARVMRRDTDLQSIVLGGDFMQPAPSNTRKRSVSVRRFLRSSIKEKCISIVSLLVFFLVQKSQIGAISAAGMCFILLSHEAGHLLASAFFNIEVLWPVFIPKIGALIILKKEMNDPYEEAWLGISGPITGLLATGLIHLAATITDSKDLAFCATAGYGMHVFNLIPLADLDGGHVAAFIGRWLWIVGALMHVALLVFFTELPWHVTLLVFVFLGTGCHKIWLWLSKPKEMERLRRETGPNARLGMAAIYGITLFISVLGLLSCLK